MALLLESKPVTCTELHHRSSLIENAYPERSGYKRKIASLWGPYYRVNYIDLETGTIPFSFFVEIVDDKIEEIR